MRPSGSRLPTRLALAALLASAALPATAIGGQAAGEGLSLAVHAGYQDVVKAGQWVPITIDVRNSGVGVDGLLEVQEALNAQPGVTGFTIYEQPISLASGASKRVRVFVVEDTTGVTVTARIIQNGKLITSQSATGSTTSTLIGVLSDQPSALDDFAAVHPGGIAARVVHLRAEDISESAIPLRAFDLLAIDDYATDGLTSGQRAAIADFVQAGGDLLLGTGAAWHKTLGGLPGSILPLAPSSTLTLHATRALGGGSVEVAAADTISGHAWLTEGVVPLIVERSVGGGSVTMATFDWAQNPVAGWDGSKALLRQVMARTVFGHAGNGSQAQIMYGIGGGGPGMAAPYGGNQPSVTSKSNALNAVLSNLPSLDLPSLQVTGALVLLYVLLVGPVNYVVLGRLRRRALSWITVPVIALLAASGAYGAGILTKGRSVQTNQVAVMHVSPGWNDGYQETYTGVIPPSRGDYQAQIAGEHLLISPIATGNGVGGSGTGTRVNVATNQVGLLGMTAFAFGGFATETIKAAPQLAGHLQLVNGKLVGTVENNSNLTFTDAVFIFGDSYQTFGTLRPGGKAAVSLAPKIATSFGNPSYMQIYTPNGYPGGGGSEADRDNFAKSQVLSLLPTGTSLKGITLAATPLFVAWTHESFQDVTVNGTHPRSTNLTAVALSLSVDQIGTGTLPAGVLNGRIVDVVGDSGGQIGIPGTFTLQNGGLTYEFAPVLAAGSHLTQVSINSQNPFNPGAAPGTVGQTGPTIAGEVWDWSRSAWSAISYQGNGTTALPDTAVNPASGLVRLRLSTTNGGTLGGNITLMGTVR
jgi:hypothetical protein